MEAVNYTKNILQKGMNTNIDNIRFPADSAWEILNGRIYSTDGKNFVVKNVDGNQVKFSLTPGYVLVGAKEYDDILYLISVNASNMVEVGSYPSLAKQSLVEPSNEYLQYSIGITSGFVNEYKPLPSILTPGSNMVYGFRTKNFNLDRDRIIFPLIKESYDGTVNIYISDGENFNRVVNSGFSKRDQEIKTERLYTAGANSFPAIDKNVNKVTKQFLSINEPPYSTLKSISSGGNLPVGNLFFYIRYLDYEFNKTNFVPLIGPIMITYGDDIFSVSGNHPTGATNYAKKNVTINVKYVDQAYKYFEIAMVWKSGTEVEGLGNKAMLINKRIPVTVDEFVDFNITGLEDMAEITIDEITTPAIAETIGKIATSLDGRYFGAHWKEFGYNKDAMRELAKKVWIRPELWNRNSLFDLDGEPMEDFDLYTVDIDGPQEIDKKYWYQSPEYVLDRVGYYRGETYPFALVGLKEDGTLTEPYPITGHDYYEDTLRAGAIANFYAGNDLDGANAGFVRMPQYGTGDADSMIDNMDYILMARAELGHMWTYLNNHLSDFEGIKGFYVVRGDRFKNLLYHGVNYPMSESASVTGDYFFGVHKTRERNIIGNKLAQSFPTIDRYPRYNGGVWNSDSYGPVYSIPSSYKTTLENYVTHFETMSTKFRKCLYSPDKLFSNIYRLKSNDICYSYIPYSNYPQWTLNSWSEISKPLYSDIYGILHGNVYVSRHNFQNNKYGRASVNGKLIRGLRSTVGYTAYSTKAYFFDEEYNYNGGSFINKIKLLNENNTTYPFWVPGDYNQKNRYIKCIGTNVDMDVYGGMNNYSSYFGDGIWDNVNIGYRYDSTTADYGNSDIASVKYLGLEYIDEIDYMYEAWKQSSMFPLLVYNQVNDAAYYTNLVNRYLIKEEPQLSEINYKLAGVYCDKENTRTYTWNNELRNLNSIYMNGDCFINRFSFRALHNKKVFDLYLDEYGNYENKANGSYYNHGTLASICLQSDSNSSVRGLANEGFWPLWASNWKQNTSTLNYNSVLCARFGGSTGINDEDFIYDWGYSETLPFNIIPGINDIYKNRTIEFITRVRYTDKHQENSFIDGWRSMYYLSKQDFPIEYGMINGIGVYNSNLIIATTDSVQQLFVNEKAIAQSEQGGSIVVGLGTIISQQSKVMSDYGTQHVGIVSTDNGVYGYDYKRSILWRVIGSSTASGSISLGCKIISENISSFLLNRFVENGGQAVVYGYDEKENEVLVTVKNKILLPVTEFITTNETVGITLPSDYNDYDWNGYVQVYRNGIVMNVRIIDLYNNILTLDQFMTTGSIVIILNKGFTLSYNEKLSSTENDFITRLGISPDIYSFHKWAIMSCNRDIIDEDVYSHDNKLQKHTFYGFNSWFKYGIVVNNGQQGITHSQTIFGSFMVTSDEEPFDVVDYETEFQKCRHYPFIDNTRFWVTPEYKENRWDFTIPENEITNNGYLPDSNMRGIWLKTLFIYKGENFKYIGEIINKNVLSFA